MKLNVNGKAQEVEAPPDMPLLWVLRDLLGLTGTKFGCGMAQCGACTVHVDGEAVRSCVTPVSRSAPARSRRSRAFGRRRRLHPVQRAWIEADVVQCGYCQSGQIMAAAALLKEAPKPTDADIDAAMSATSAAAARTSASARPSTWPRTWLRPEARRERARRTVATPVPEDVGRAGHRLHARPEGEDRRAPGGRGRREAAAASRRVPAHRRRRHGHGAAGALGDGPGHLDDAADDGRRGARAATGRRSASSTRRRPRSTRTRTSACR